MKIVLLFLTAKTVNPPRFPLHVPNESIADKHPSNIQIFCRSYAFAVKGFCTLLLAFKIRSSTQFHSCTYLETNLTLTCPSPQSSFCNLPDSGRHVTSVFQGLSLSLSRSVGRVGESYRNEVANVLAPSALLPIGLKRQKWLATFSL